MERLDLSGTTMDHCVRHAADVLRSGGVILYPTDTLYGLGADAFSDEAVEKVYAIKGRDEKKPTSCIVADMEMAQQYAEIIPDARLMIERLMPGPLTIILKKKTGFDRGIGRGIDTIGIRIPKNDFCLALAREFGRPFTATSANIAGLQPKRSVDTIFAQITARHSSILQNTRIDLIINAGELPPSLPSTVVDLSGEEPIIVREGTIPVADIWNAIRAEA